MASGLVGPASRGSRKCLQDYVDQRPHELTNLIATASVSLLAFSPSRVDWLSPLRQDDFREYRDDFLQPLGLTQHERAIRDFWPAQGPQWDGLAMLAGRGKIPGILLVEAKAHPDETQSDMKATDPRSIEQIRKAFARVQGYMGVTQGDWFHGAYQLANRLAFLYFLNVVIGIPTFLALVNFVNDTSFKPTDLGQWRQHYTDVFNALGLYQNAPLLDHVVMVFPTALNP